MANIDVNDVFAKRMAQAPSRVKGRGLGSRVEDGRVKVNPLLILSILVLGSLHNRGINLKITLGVV